MHYVGLDLHFRQSTICVLDDHGRRVLSRTVPGLWSEVLDQIAAIPKPFAVCFEASTGYGHLSERLQRIAHRVVVGLARLDQFRGNLERLVEELLPVAREGEEDELALLRMIANQAIAEEPRPQLRDLPDRVRHRIGQPEVPLETTYARVMSFQKSKGLTSDLVVLAGLVDGAMPRVKDGDPPAERQAQLEEQRRLFFVGMTRTTKILLFSSYSMLPDNIARQITTRIGNRTGRSFRVFPSPFLDECGGTLVRAIHGEAWVDRYR